MAPPRGALRPETGTTRPSGSGRRFRFCVESHVRRWARVSEAVSRGEQETVVLELSGSEARRGLPISTLESFFEEIIRSLRAFDRGARLEPALRSGQPSRRDKLVTAFRVVGLKPGSAIITLEPDSTTTDGELNAVDPGSVALANLEALMAPTPQSAAAASRRCGTAAAGRPSACQRQCRAEG